MNKKFKETWQRAIRVYKERQENPNIVASEWTVWGDEIEPMEPFNSEMQALYPGMASGNWSKATRRYYDDDMPDCSRRCNIDPVIATPEQIEIHIEYLAEFYKLKTGKYPQTVLQARLFG